MLLALTEISPLHWAAFVAAVLFFLALDLGVFHRKAHVVSFKEAMVWTTVWFALAMVFAFFVAPAMAGNWQTKDTDEFVTGYLIELSLSMDNVFVIALIFSFFKVPVTYQHRVLFWGILGALVMRGTLIWGGAELIRRFDWLLYGLGAFLVFSGLKMLFVDGDGVDLENNRIVRLSRRYLPFTDRFEGPRFVTRKDGRRLFTPLFLVLIIVETTDLVFAVDSIPAIFGITKNPFIVFTSNVFAILGLRSLYFVLAGAIGYFRYLKYGLSVVLVFIGGKMLAMIWDLHMEPRYSLYVVVGILVVSVAASLAAGWLERRRRALGGKGGTPPETS
jgi:tellurite resistance protein TerC